MTEIPANTPSPIGRTESFLPGSSNSWASAEACSTALPLASVLGVLDSEVVVAFGADSVAAGSAAGEDVVAAGTDGEGAGGADEEEGDGAGGTGVEDD
jgi:hypothetical protein